MAGAIETKKQENGSKVVFESVIEKGRFPSTSEIERVYPNVPAKWVDNYKLQSQALKKYLGSNKGYVYSRDTGIMPFIERLANKQMGVTKKDAWNPMDIIMVKKNLEIKIMKEIEKIAELPGMLPKDRLIKLNLYMKDLLKKKVMLPISLKEIKAGVKEAALEESNVDAKSKGVNFSLVPTSLTCDLDVTKPPLLDTGEFGFKMQVDDEQVKVQVRSFRYSKPSTSVQTDLTPIGRQSGAKLGKAAADATSTFLSKINLQRPPSPTQDNMIAVDGKFTKSQIEFWDKFYKQIKDVPIEGNKVNWDAPIDLGKKQVTFKKIIEYCLENKEKDRNVLGRLFSKLVTLRHIHMYQTISKKKMFKEWLSVLYYGAKKEFSDTNGPFIKIY
tara:strand:- start:149 stop:1306 length:1158 start_codon:yes stop_codon:yes gene_type:complete